MPIPTLQIKIFESNSIKILEKEINGFLTQFTTAEIKTVSITLSEKLFYVIVVFAV